jgi:chromosome segregation ATPase
MFVISVHRNSKLTFLLQNSLGGNSRTMVVFTLCPTESNMDESLFTLQFASRVRNISLGAAVKYSNVKNLETVVKNMKVEIKELRKKKIIADETIADLKKEIKKLSEKNLGPVESKIKMLEDSKKASDILVQQLTKQLQEMGHKSADEKQHQEKLTNETEMIQKNLKRALDQIKELKGENDKLQTLLKSKERELESIQAALLRNIGTSSNSTANSQEIFNPSAESKTKKEKIRVSFTLNDAEGIN